MQIFMEKYLIMKFVHSIFPAIGLTHWRTSFELLRTLESLQLLLAGLCLQSSSNNKCGMPVPFSSQILISYAP